MPRFLVQSMSYAMYAKQTSLSADFCYKMPNWEFNTNAVIRRIYHAHITAFVFLKIFSF